MPETTRSALPLSGRPVAFDIGRGDPLVLLPGMLCEASLFRAMLPALASRHRVIGLDWPGHAGRALPAAPWRMEALVADLLQTLDGLRLPEVSLLGFSLGGMVALRLALRQPQRVRRLVLLSSSGGAEDRLRRLRFLALSALARRIGVPDWMAGQAAQAMFSAAARQRLPSLVAQWRQQLQQLPPETVAEVVAMVAQRSTLLPELQQLRCPTLVMCGELDRNTPPAHARALALAIPGARLQLLPGAGHALPLECPQAVLRGLQDWLQDLRRFTPVHHPASMAMS